MTLSERHIPNRRRAFTLLELLLAVTILASITSLVAVTWAQMNAWADESGEEHRQMQLHRALKLMTDQWEDRRSTTGMGDNTQRIITGDTGIGFLTATPILFPDWPVVRVGYRIEPARNRAPGAARAWNLVYIEQRVVEFSKPKKDEDKDSDSRKEQDKRPTFDDVFTDETRIDRWGNELSRRIILLEQCDSLSIERFGIAADLYEEAGIDPPSTEDDSDDAPDRLDPMDSGAIDAARNAGVSDDVIRTATEMQWRSHGRYAGFIPAVRLVGSYEEREFSCVFAIRALH